MRIRTSSVTCEEAPRHAEGAARRLCIVLGRLAEDIADVRLCVERLAVPGISCRVVAFARVELRRAGARPLVQAAGADAPRAIEALFGHIARFACAGRAGAPLHRGGGAPDDGMPRPDVPGTRT